MGARDGEQRCELVTVVGDAGVGKSRLVAEALSPLEAQDHPRPLSPLRRGNHVLAGRRGRQAARRAPVGSRRRRRRSARCSARASRRRARRTSPGRSASSWRSRRRSPSSSTTSTGATTRFLDLVEGDRPPLGRRAAPARLRRPPGAARAGVTDGRPRSGSSRCRGDAVDELLRDSVRRRCASASPAAAGGNPLFLTEMLAMAQGDGERRGAADAPRPARGPARPARRPRAARARARRRRG